MLPDKVRAALIPCDRLVGIQAVVAWSYNWASSSAGRAPRKT